MDKLRDTQRYKRDKPYVSFEKRTIKPRTTALYIAPMPYAQRQLFHIFQRLVITKKQSMITCLALATRKPKAKGDKKGEIMKPIVQMLSYAQ